MKTTTKMTTKSLLLLVALILCCTFAAVHGSPSGRCYCLRTSSKPFPVHTIKKVEVIPISGNCRWKQIIVTKKNDKKFCIDPNVSWLDSLFNFLKRKNTNDGNPNDGNLIGGNSTAVPTSHPST
ncbi:C-X-C motif chemokine 10-like [Scomber japonicus]|uniref:C-X-C motif chemokine 10-like n=1 Tax=Scomber japonicus TaxID=13676 RepID=UPI002306B21A|nr:C-X-C motif chemokine 10-like [Scomber japonicus]